MKTWNVKRGSFADGLVLAQESKDRFHEVFQPPISHVGHSEDLLQLWRQIKTWFRMYHITVFTGSIGPRVNLLRPLNKIQIWKCCVGFKFWISQGQKSSMHSLQEVQVRLCWSKQTSLDPSFALNPFCENATLLMFLNEGRFGHIVS